MKPRQYLRKVKSYLMQNPIHANVKSEMSISFEHLINQIDSLPYGESFADNEEYFSLL